MWLCSTTRRSSGWDDDDISLRALLEKGGEKVLASLACFRGEMARIFRQLSRQASQFSFKIYGGAYTHVSFNQKGKIQFYITIMVGNAK